MRSVFALAESRWARIGAALLCVAIPIVWLGSLMVGEEDPVRLRSALLFEMGTANDFAFDPQHMPPTFLINKGPVAPQFQNVAKDIQERTPAPRGEFDVGLEIARYLMQGPKQQGGAIRADLLTTLDAIKGEGRGYCADFAKVFNGLAVATSLPVRQWGFAFNAFGSGHTFNEVYDRARNKWIAIDSFHSLYFVDAASREPLSALEVHDALLSLQASPRAIAIERIVPARFPFRSDEIAFDYYRRGMPQLFLEWGNNVFDYEATLVFRTTSAISRSVEQLLSIAAGHYPRMRVYPIGVSDRDVDELRLYRTRFGLAFGAALLATLVFLLQFPGFLRQRSSQ